MIFIYDEDASKEQLNIRGELHKYLIKVRRHEVGDRIDFRKKSLPELIYHYEVESIDPRHVNLRLVGSEESVVKHTQKLHIGWCVIDPKSVEKVLATLNEIGVERINFIYCERSQKSFKPDIARFERILEASNQQCGRSHMMEFVIYKDLNSYLKEYPDVKVFDFCDTELESAENLTSVLIGCEGGFSQSEKELLSAHEVFRLKAPLVLRSESAVVGVASKILL